MHSQLTERFLRSMQEHNARRARVVEPMPTLVVGGTYTATLQRSDRYSDGWICRHQHGGQLIGWVELQAGFCTDPMAGSLAYIAGMMAVGAATSGGAP